MLQQIKKVGRLARKFLFFRQYFIRVVIFEHPFETTLATTSFLSLFIGQKQWREEKEERE